VLGKLRTSVPSAIEYCGILRIISAPEAEHAAP
jgi:hypothetical protein